MKNKSKIILIALINFVIWIGHPTKLLAQEYNIEIKPSKTDSFNVAKFSFYVPQDSKNIKGVLHWIYPVNKDGREVSKDADYREFCNELGFALIGSQIDSRELEKGLGDAYLKAIDSVSKLSNHPELKIAPIFFLGYSWGGQWAYDFALWNPNKVIGVITQKGGYHNVVNSNRVINIPIYMFVGELDVKYRIDNLTGIFNEHRPKGAPWALAIDLNKGHTPVLDKDILLPYVKEIISLRLPEWITNQKEVVLRKLDLKKGWQGNLQTKEIGRYGTLSAKPEELVWMPNKENALIWQKFMKDKHN